MSANVLYLETNMKKSLDAGFAASFEGAPERYFSAPGRTEIGGNHTDHQRGRVLAGAVNLDTVAAVRCNGTKTIRIQSKGYPLSVVDLENLTPVEAEINSTPALIRGVAARFVQMGCQVEGFDASCESTVLPGSGLSSSAAYEVLIGTIINGLFFNGKVSQPEIAMIGQYAENVFFGKPCGLMDQMASAVGNLVTIDFFDKEHPVIEPVDFDFASCGHALCIIDSGADQADLTDEYAAVTQDFKKLCAHFGKEVLTEVPEMFGAEHLLMQRCENEEIFNKTVALINDFKDYYTRHNQVIYENPSPGNKKGGITTLEEKSLGCVQKGGLSKVVDVLDYGDRLTKNGLSLLNGPGNDIVAITNLMAAGVHIILFTTGRGTPVGGPVPTVKIATNHSLAERKSSWIDFDASPILEGNPLTDELFDYVISVANGEETRNEINDYREISIFKDGVTL